MSKRQSPTTVLFRTTLTRTITQSYELFLRLDNTTCCLFFFLFVFTGIWYTILKAVTKISVVVNVRNVTRVTDPCLLMVTLFDKGFERKITYEKSDIGHDLYRYGLNIMDLT